MKINVFGKQLMSRDGRSFTTYFTRLTKVSTGEKVSFNVKFRQDCGAPDYKQLPCVIDIPKEKSNMVESFIYDEAGIPVVDDNGEPKLSRTLWVTEWAMVGPYIDHSLDDYGE